MATQAEKDLATQILREIVNAHAGVLTRGVIKELIRHLRWLR